MYWIFVSLNNDVGEFPLTINHTLFEPGSHRLTITVNSTTGQVAEKVIFFTVHGIHILHVIDYLSAIFIVTHLLVHILSHDLYDCTLSIQCHSIHLILSQISC